MEDEIKEILNKLNNMMTFDENLIGWQIDGNGTTISKKDFKILLDYITNLQQSDIDKQLEIMKLKDKLEQQRKEYQETYKDVRIELKEKDETITNLQEEKDKFKEYAKNYLKSKIDRKNEELELVKTKFIEEHNKCYDYKQRNEKAKEHAEFLYKNEANIFYKGTYKKQLDILNGGDEE